MSIPLATFAMVGTVRGAVQLLQEQVRFSPPFMASHLGHMRTCGEKKTGASTTTTSHRARLCRFRCLRRTADGISSASTARGAILTKESGERLLFDWCGYIDRRYPALTKRVIVANRPMDKARHTEGGFLLVGTHACFARFYSSTTVGFQIGER
jgi:hypothetical protein